MAETFNAYIIKSRSKPIIDMLEDIRVAIMTRLINMQTNMASEDVIVCPRIHVKLDKEKYRAYKCEVYPSSYNVFQVKELTEDVSVDLINKTCTCRKWDLRGIPCKHVCAVAGFLNTNAEEYVSECYYKEQYMKSYAFTIPPLASEKYWPTVNYPLDPPPIKAAPGRPKKNRKRDPHENPKKPGKLTKHGVEITCGSCMEKGHNKKGCKNKKRSRSQEAGVKKPRGRPKKARVEATLEQHANQSSTKGHSQQPDSQQLKKSISQKSRGRQGSKGPKSTGDVKGKST